MMRKALREHDKRHPITVGMLDDLDSGFVPEKVADELDIVAVHIYPRSGMLDHDLNVLRRFQVGSR